MSDLRPMPHPDPWVNLLHSYVTDVTRALAQGGCALDACWLDPSEPRDGTIVLNTASGPKNALVFNEETGWSAGRFVSGWQGVRTQLENAVHLGGGVAPPAEELARRYLTGQTAPAVLYRSYADRDGLSDHLG